MIFEYRCSECGDIFEKYVTSENKDLVTCIECGARATRLVSPPNFKLDGTDPSFPTTWDKWANMHEREAKRAKQKEE